MQIRAFQEETGSTLPALLLSTPGIGHFSLSRLVIFTGTRFLRHALEQAEARAGGGTPKPLFEGGETEAAAHMLDMMRWQAPAALSLEVLGQLLALLEFSMADRLLQHFVGFVRPLVEQAATADVATGEVRLLTCNCNARMLLFRVGARIEGEIVGNNG